MEEIKVQESTVTDLANEFHVSEDLARMVMTESEGELQKVRDILQGMLPNYLVVKTRFISPKPSGGSGVVLIVIKRGERKFLLFRTIYSDDRNWAEDINVHQPVDAFLGLIRDYFKENPSSSRIFDAEKLRKGLKPLQDVGALQYLFDLWDKPKVEVVEEVDPMTEFQDPGTVLTGFFQKTLDDALLDSVQVYLDYDFYTETQFDTISQALGLKLKMKAGMSDVQAITSEDENGFKVYLRGQFVIDALNGVPVQDLEIGDKVYCEITDKTAVAVTVGKMVGAYKRGLWAPIRGTITDIQDTESERKMATVAVAKGVYVNVVSIEDIRIRTLIPVTKVHVQEEPEKRSDTSMIPILVGVGLLAFQILILLLLR